ncbi:MAG TPA: hypothetical protein VGB85_00430 [Nannocystis sp.]
MSPARKTLLWMAGLSLVTLLLGVLREFWIARELRASGEADLFFRGLVIVGAARAVGNSLFRSRWIPIPMHTAATALLRAEAGTMAGMTGVALVSLWAIAGVSALRDPTLWVFAVAVPLAIVGSAIRALAERAGLERRGFVLEWALPLGAIAGALLVPHGALGPALGILAGLIVGLAALVPPVLAGGADLAHGTGPVGQAPPVLAGAPAGADLARGTGLKGQVIVSEPGRMRVLLLDAMVYANLGLLDAALSHLFADGGFALLNYSYLFVNAALMVPSAAATVVGLRTAASGDPDAHAVLRRWAVLGGLVCAGLVVVVGLMLGWGPVAREVDAAVGWSLAASIGGLVMWSAPYAGLRLANTIGRQYVIASEPRRVIMWDLTGLLGRALILGFGAAVLGLVASPIGLAFAEVLQLGAWWRQPKLR